MASIAELLFALQSKEDDLNTRLKILDEKHQAKLALGRIRNNENYAKRRALQLASPDYVPPKIGRPSKPQADIV